MLYAYKFSRIMINGKYDSGEPQMGCTLLRDGWLAGWLAGQPTGSMMMMLVMMIMMLVRMVVLMMKMAMMIT